MTITTERAEELAVQRDHQEDYRCAESIRALTEERDNLLRSVESYQFALAETEALEMQHGAVIARLKTIIRNLEARDIHSCGPDCQRSGCVNRGLREQLAAVETERDELKVQLAAVQATIAKKNEAIELGVRVFGEGEAIQAVSVQEFRNALAIPSDDTALREMLAEQWEKAAKKVSGMSEVGDDSEYVIALRAEAEKIRKDGYANN